MTNEELTAYCFGFFDGEGSVTIRRQIDKRQGGLVYQYSVGIAASQKSLEPLVILKAMFGGQIGIIYRRGIPVIHSWCLTGRKKQLVFLRAALNYSRCKTAEIEIAIRFLSSVGPSRNGKVRRLDAAVRNERHVLYEASLSIRKLRNSMIDRRGQLELPASVQLFSECQTQNQQ